jgi:anti-anti-sigma factor
VDAYTVGQDPDPIRVELAPRRAHGYDAVVYLCGEHDLATSPELGIVLAPIHGNLLVDLSECGFIDSTVIAALIEKFEDLRREGHRLELVVPPGATSVRRAVEIIGLGTLMTVHDSMPDSNPGIVDGLPAGGA